MHLVITPMINVYEELAEESRRMILAELRSGAKRVSDIVAATGLKQPNVSNHLARMRDKQILDSEKLGREVFYSLGNPDIAEAVRIALSGREGSPETEPLESRIGEYAFLATSGDEQACAAQVDDLLREEMPLLTIYTDFLTPCMTLVGQWYKQGQIDEAQEHYASNITERMMARAMHSRVTSRKTGRTAILGLAPDNWHVLGIRMVSDYLRLLGWKTLYLGANVPVESFVSSVRQHQPDLVLTSCSTEENISKTLPLLASLHALKDTGVEITIGVGGNLAKAYEGKLRAAGSDFVAGSLGEFAETLLPRF